MIKKEWNEEEEEEISKKTGENISGKRVENNELNLEASRKKNTEKSGKFKWIGT